MIVGIYKITNPKGKIYVGQSTNLKKREEDYKKLKCKGQTKLYNSLKKYGFENHKFEIIETCFLEKLNKREIYWGLHYEVLEENGLNLKLGNANGLLNKETKQKIRKAMLGKKQSEETINKRINKIKGVPKPKGFGENHSKKLKGVPKPEGFKKKLSESRKNTLWSPSQHQIELGILARNKPTLQFDKNGNFIMEHVSSKKAAEHVGVHEVNMRSHLRGKYKTCKGHIFKYKDNE
jgi:group I intron endonuclease